ncbi:MAG: bifunctional UDP-N-acetylglucosamine diphosphorylase/glucosamine-1-phosphate N-acetyltransferase GlmU [Clostridia bacterium]
MEDVRGLILAAGQGTRMKSDLLKVLHPVMGVPMISLVVEALKDAEIPHPAVVIGYQGDRVRETLGSSVEYAVQSEQKGTGHAVVQATHLLEGYRDVLILYGDVPLVTGNLLANIVRRHRSSGAAATLLTAMVEDPTGLGRVIRDEKGDLVSIVEEADASHAESAIREINTAIACFRVEHLLRCLPHLRADNVQGEYYLPDVFPMLLEQNLAVETVTAPDARSVMGVNTRAGLAAANSILRRRILEDIMESGVTVVDPESTWIEFGVRVGRDTVIMPQTLIRGESVVGSGCEIGPGTHLINSVVGDESRVWHSVLEDSTLGTNVSVGPYAHLRPGNDIADEVRIGNFAEIKNSSLGRGTKVSHHSYIGDTEVGEKVNIGAGVITVNYDGWQKHLTIIDDGAFVGCNSNLLAPVTVGEGAFIAAGSTVDCDVPPGALGVGRSRMAIKDGWANERRERQRRSRPFEEDNRDVE